MRSAREAWPWRPSPPWPRPRWDLAVTGGPPSLRPLCPALLYRAPLPRTKLEASVPDGLVTGVLDVDGHQVGVDRWRGTVGHNWGAEHADCRVWVHAAGFGAGPQAWLELVLARIRVGRAAIRWHLAAVGPANRPGACSRGLFGDQCGIVGGARVGWSYAGPIPAVAGGVLAAIKARCQSVEVAK